MPTAASIRRAAVAMLALCIAVPVVAEAQGRDRPNRPPRQHDRSNPWNPPGRQHDRSNPWNPGRFPPNWPNPWDRGAAASMNASTVSASAVTASPAGARAAAVSTPAARTLVFANFRGADRAERSALVAALSTRDNIAAFGQAERLAKALDGLAADPKRLPETVEAYNAFVRASSAAFLRAPSPEFLAVRELLGSATELAFSRQAADRQAVDVADAGR